MLEKQRFSPDTTIPPDATSVDLWAEISSTDDSGITVDGIVENDLVEILDVSGICSFDDNSLGKKILSIVAIISGTFASAAHLFKADEVAKRVTDFKAQASELDRQLGNAIRGSRRDGYGQDPGTGDFATKEGGLLVCMPKARGVFYATEENWLHGGAKTAGRLPKHVSKNLKNHNCFFPCRAGGGVHMKRKAEQNGVLHIVAFDSRYGDNAGKYEVKLRVRRKPQAKPEAEK